jgi:hypothetical protein
MISLLYVQTWSHSEHALGRLHRVYGSQCVKPHTSIYSRYEELTGPAELQALSP